MKQDNYSLNQVLKNPLRVSKKSLNLIEHNQNLNQNQKLNLSKMYRNQSSKSNKKVIEIEENEKKSK